VYKRPTSHVPLHVPTDHTVSLSPANVAYIQKQKDNLLLIRLGAWVEHPDIEECILSVMHVLSYNVQTSVILSVTYVVNTHT